MKPDEQTKPRKQFGKVSAVFIALGISCIVNLAVHIPFIYFTGVKMHMGPLSMISSIAFFASFYWLLKRRLTAIIIASAVGGIILIAVLDVPSSGLRNSEFTQTPASENRSATLQPEAQANLPSQMAQVQKPMTSIAPSAPGFGVDRAIEAKLHTVTLKIYREYPFLDSDNEKSNSKAISAVAQTCAGLVKRGMSMPDALRVAASQVGPKFGPSDEKLQSKASGMTPLGDVSIDSFCIMLSKPVPPYNSGN